MLTSWKFLCLGLLFVITFAVGLLPLKLRNIRQTIANGLSCFCGGLLIGVCFLDFLPSVRPNNHKSILNANYPFIELFIVVGFLFVLTLDKIADVLICQLQERQEKECLKRHQHSDTQIASQGTACSHHVVTEKSPLIRHECPPLSTTVDVAVTGEKKCTKTPALPNGVRQESTKRRSCCSLWLASISIGTILRSLALVGAVSIHSLLEGMVIGLEESKWELFQLTAFITFHKTLVMFSIGVTFTDRGLSLGLYLKEMVLLCLSSPAGVVAGMVVTSINGNFDQTPAAMILKCLATGTFLFIAVFEILGQKLIVKHAKDLWNVLFCIVGFGCFAGLTAIPKIQSGRK